MNERSLLEITVCYCHMHGHYCFYFDLVSARLLDHSIRDRQRWQQKLYTGLWLTRCDRDCIS
jgi:hypothetical protein